MVSEDYRLSYRECRDLLEKRLAEAPPSRIQLLAGPRQVGKTTLLLEPAIGRDLLALAAVRKPALLRQVFGVCASSPAQIVSLQKIQGQLQDAGALETIVHYLALLEEAFLIALVTKYSPRPARRPA